MARRKPGLHKDLSKILDGARIPEEARGRRSEGRAPADPPVDPARVQQDVRARAADNLVPPGPPSAHPPINPAEVHQDIRARAADNLVPPGPEYTGPRWVIGDETEEKRGRKKSRGLLGVLRRIGRLMAGAEPEDLENETRISEPRALEPSIPENAESEPTNPERAE